MRDDDKVSSLRDLIENLDKEMDEVRIQRLRYEKQYGGAQGKGLSERFNPRFKQLNNKLERIDYISYIHSLEKKNLTEMADRLRQLAILKSERKYRAFDY